MKFEDIPRIILLVGTDASGKDHLANILEKAIQEAGGEVEKRKQYLTGEATGKKSSTDKNLKERLTEIIILHLFPLLSRFIPHLMDFLLQKDLKNFRPSRKNLIIVGHNCLRGLAFAWGHTYKRTEEIQLSKTLANTLNRLKNVDGLHIFVLDIDDQIRKKRVQKRIARNEADNFDRYMASDSDRSERIESHLVWLVQQHLDGKLIENNDLSEEELMNICMTSFHDTQKQRLTTLPPHREPPGD